jgi:hypothetical protein
MISHQTFPFRYLPPLCVWPAPLHNRYTRAETCVRLGMAVTYNRYKYATASLPKRLRDGRFASENTAVLEAKRSPGSRSGFKYPLELLESSRYNSFSKRGRRAWL